MSNEAAEHRVYTTTTVEGYPEATPPYVNFEIILSSDKPASLMEAIIHKGTYEECVDFAKKYCTNCKVIVK